MDERKQEQAHTTVKLQKLLSEAGVGARRKCEDYIRKGRVSVNGTVVRELGARVSPDATIHLDGKPVEREERVCYAFHKPEGVISAMKRTPGKNARALSDYLSDIPYRLFHAGRLDRESRGLMILTNDGDLAHKIMHPSYGVEKVYHVTLQGTVQSERVLAASKGITVKGVHYAPFQFKVLRKNRFACLLRITINEGKNREIRNIFQNLGYEVADLLRTAVGPVRLEDDATGAVAEGMYRELTEKEIAFFRSRKRVPRK